MLYYFIIYEQCMIFVINYLYGLNTQENLHVVLKLKDKTLSEKLPLHVSYKKILLTEIFLAEKNTKFSSRKVSLGLCQSIVIFSSASKVM